jgi:hypothetical protein
MGRKAVEWHEAPDGRRFQTFIGDCLCSPCWQGRCECGEALTKHDFDREGAVACALEVLRSPDPRKGFGHVRCASSPAQGRLL